MGLPLYPCVHNSAVIVSRASTRYENLSYITRTFKSSLFLLSMIRALIPGQSSDIDTLLNRKQRNRDGTESLKYYINEEFIAMLDLLIYSSVSANVDCIRAQHDWYVMRVATYKRFDGQGGMRSWRTELIECLKNWLLRFPNSVKSSHGRAQAGRNFPRSLGDEVEQVARSLPASLL